jgi:hypothetical protein
MPSYKLYWPRFTSDASGTRVTMRWPISNQTSPQLPAGSLVMAGTANSAEPNGTTVAQNLFENPDASFIGTFQLGCAITANNANGYVLPTQSDYFAVGSPLQLDPSGGLATPTITQTELVSEFAMPARPSTLFIGFKLPQATTGNTSPVGSSFIAVNDYWSPNLWFGFSSDAHIFNDPSRISASGDWRDRNVVLSTWYSPGVSISASGGASVGNTSRLTITAPDSLRTLTASDFTASGGTISSFTKVS